MRRGELLNVRWRDIDLQRGLLHIPTTKTGSSRTIPLTPKASELFIGLDMDSSKVISLSANALRRLGEIVQGCGIDLRFHDLRHEAVSRFFEMGLSMAEVQLISGHKDIRMLMRYTHLKPEVVRDKLSMAADSGSSF